MASYAPLFENVNRRDWPVNLILLDSSRAAGRSSYQVQKMFSAHRPDVVLATTVRAAEIPWQQLGLTNQASLTNQSASGSCTRWPAWMNNGRK